MIELKNLLFGTDNETGLEVVVLLAAQTELGTLMFVCADEDGQVKPLYASQLKLNWRYDRNKMGWVDLDDTPPERPDE